jgi:hypothetical protein
MEDQLSGKGVLIDKDTGKVHDLGEVTVTKLDGGPLLPDYVLPKGFDAQKSYTWTLKLSKRKGRKFEYEMKRLCMPPKRTYLSKRELVTIIERAFFPNGLPLPVSYYMERSHRQLMNFIMNTAYLMKKNREMRVFLPLIEEEKGGACHA